MFEKVNRLAQRAATNVSRRQFLGSVGHCAMTLAAVVGGLLALPGEAQAVTVCGPASVSVCRGRPVGSPCGNFMFRGTCQSPSVCSCVRTSRR